MIAMPTAECHGSLTPTNMPSAANALVRGARTAETATHALALT